MKESAVSNHARLRAAQLGLDLWRNNSGGFYDENGRFVRYGLGSFVPEKDKKKSSDYIGITPIFITPQMVGSIIGTFTAMEMKEQSWKYNPNDKHSLYQKNFLDIVRKAGGRAGFVTCDEDVDRIIRNETRF